MVFESFPDSGKVSRPDGASHLCNDFALIIGFNQVTIKGLPRSLPEDISAFTQNSFPICG